MAFKIPLPVGISNDLPWGGYGFVLELYIIEQNFTLSMYLLYMYSVHDFIRLLNIDTEITNKMKLKGKIEIQHKMYMYNVGQCMKHFIEFAKWGG